jgi:Zn-dependent protease with chaperone function
MYELLGISLVLAALLTINAFASLAAAAGWRLLKRPMRNCSARTRAEVLFFMRISPPVLAIFSVVVFLAPSFLVYEPYSTTEVVSKKLATLAGLSAAGITFAFWRSIRSWLATRTLRRKWLASADQIRLAGIGIPTYRIRHQFPIIAVVGTVRPRLFIAEKVLRTLSDSEMAAAIAHECGHLAARDNLKRSLLRGCRDALMIVPCGRSLDRAWAETAECAADEHAAEQSAATALNLASALVKIAKMVPAGAHAAVPLAAYLVGAAEIRGVRARVGRLLEIASADRRRAPNSRLAGILTAASLSLFVILGAMVAGNTQILVTVHSLIEHAVRVLS